MNIFDRLFGQGKSTKPYPTQSRESSTSPSDGEGAEDSAFEAKQDEFLLRLRNVLSDRGDVISGRLHMIGLEKVKPSFGTRWPQVADKAHEIAKLAIERRLNPTDLYTRFGDLSYLLVFGNLGRADAQVKCALIAREIAEKLLGTQAAAKLMQVSCVSMKENGRLIFEDLGDLDALVREFETRWAEQKAVESDVERAALQWVTEEDMERSWEVLAKQIGYIYRPMWTVRSQAVTAYHCLPTRPGEDGGMLVGYDVIPRDAPPRFIPRLDGVLLRKAAQELTWLRSADKPLLLAIPVHFETLARTRSRVAYINDCHDIPEELRRYLVLELVGVEDGIPSGRLIELTSALCTECRALLIRLPIGFTDFDAVGKTQATACGLAVDEPTMAEALLFKEFNRFCEEAEQVHKQKYVHGLSSPSLLTAALGAGFDYVDGETVASVTEEPEAAHRLGLEGIFFRPESTTEKEI